MRGPFDAQRNPVAVNAFAVDAVADANAVLHRLDVNIACAIADGLADHRLHELDDRRLGGIGAAGVFAHAGQVHRFVNRAVDGFVHRAVQRFVQRIAQPIDRAIDCFVDRVGRTGVEQLVQNGLDPALGGQDGSHVLVQAETQDFQHLEVQGIVDGKPQFSALHAQRKHQVFAHEVVWNQIDRIGGDRTLVQVDVFHVVLLGQGLIDVDLAAQFQVNQGLANAQALGLGVLKGLGDLAGGDDAPLNEDFT